MPPCVLPATLKESMAEPIERLSARVFILRYLDALPADARTDDHEALHARLERERDALARTITWIVDSWREGGVSLLWATEALRDLARQVA